MCIGTTYSILCDFGTYTSFISPFVRYIFLRLPFGILSAPEIFYTTFWNLFESVEGVRVYIDDILVTGQTREEHGIRLMQVLEIAIENGVKFNKKQCKIGLSRVNYVDHVLSKKSVEIDENRIAAIKRIPELKNVGDVKRFLGTIPYVSQFISYVFTCFVNDNKPA